MLIELAVAVGAAMSDGLCVERGFDDNGLALYVVLTCVPCDSEICVPARPHQPEAAIERIAAFTITHSSEETDDTRNTHPAEA